MHGITLWKVGDECILTHSTTHAPAPCGSGSPFIAASGTGFGTSATSFISTLSGIAELTLNGTLVECFGPAFSRGAGNRVGNRTVQIIGQFHFCLLTDSVQYLHYGTLAWARFTPVYTWQFGPSTYQMSAIKYYLWPGTRYLWAIIPPDPESMTTGLVIVNHGYQSYLIGLSSFVIIVHITLQMYTH